VRIKKEKREGTRTKNFPSVKEGKLLTLYGEKETSLFSLEGKEPDTETKKGEARLEGFFSIIARRGGGGKVGASSKGRRSRTPRESLY